MNSKNQRIEFSLFLLLDEPPVDAEQAA